MDNETIGIVPEAQVVREDTPETRASFRVSVFGTGSKKSEHDENAIALVGGLATTVIRDVMDFYTPKSCLPNCLSVDTCQEVSGLQNPITLSH